MSRGQRLLQLYVVLATTAAMMLIGIGASKIGVRQPGETWILAGCWAFGSAVLLVLLVDVIWPLVPRLARLREWISGDPTPVAGDPDE